MNRCRAGRGGKCAGSQRTRAVSGFAISAVVRLRTAAQEDVAAAEFAHSERNFMAICVLAPCFAELGAPPTMRHKAETASTVIAG